MTMLVEIEPDEAAYTRLIEALATAGLPTGDLQDGAARYFALRDAAGDFLAFGGLAGSGEDLLLRSVVVEPKRRLGGLGATVVGLLSREAMERGAKALWLLTDSAASFFRRHGWEETDRGGAPAAIAGSAQMRGLRPASAMLMVKRLIR